MELGSWWMVFTTLGAAFVTMFWLVKRANEWFFTRKLGNKQYPLPPGDMGWPLIGNMWSFLFAFKYGDPDSFISSFVNRFGRTGIYKALMFGNPSVIVTMPETCRQVLMDDKRFKQGWPKSTYELLGKKSFMSLSDEEHKRLRRLTASPIRGQEALSMYHEYIKEVIITSLDEWSSREQPFEFLTEIRKITFKIIMHIFLSVDSGPMLETMEKLYTDLNHGLRAMAINLPGFAYHKAIKGRKKLVKILQDVVEGRRAKKKSDGSEKDKDMMDLLIETEDENGGRLDNEEIIDIILVYLNAGHESSAHALMWVTLFLHDHPEYFLKAKAEQEELVKRKEPTETELSLRETKQMEYLSKVIDETLRIANISLLTFREASTNVNIGGYLVPQGWKVLVWFRAVNLDSENHLNPTKFDPQRWDEHKPKAGSYIHFGTGSRLCPGSELTKLEISTFLHYFLLSYKLERINPGCSVRYLPHVSPKDNCLARIKKLS
ncbi:ent-kaurenoic acid oxidase 2-like [Pistacia vera]|uniref:ent-kaurenoic acid oxidase 2-like n=1 Tax=Pistacia vera TaxID=55513 RepID=UPI001262F2C4|nr:ent-kaurenoic acid oxidase 2-like [Pistacia vera]